MPGRNTEYVSYPHLLYDLMESKAVGSRLGPVREKLHTTYRFNPRDAVFRPGMSHSLKLAELFQLLGGVFDPSALRKAAPRANHDFFTYQMAYGPRIQPYFFEVGSRLAMDADSRRAILILPTSAEDEPTCTTSIHFLVREGKLLTFVNMRSWDAWLGLPYDIIMFGGLAQAMAAFLRVEEGPVRITASSLHLYSEHCTDKTMRAETMLNAYKLNVAAIREDDSSAFWSKLKDLALDELTRCPWDKTPVKLVESIPSEYAR